MEIQKSNEDKMLPMLLTAGITNTGGIDVAPVDRMKVKMELRKFKDDRGGIDFGKLIKLPLANRIDAMAERDMRGTVTMVAVALTLAMETMNLKRPMTGIQIVDLAEDIVESSAEDKIAIEDLMLFLQKLTRGEYGELYESFDAIKLMHSFNKFRDERWEEGVRIRDAQHEEFKKIGDSNWHDRNNQSSPIGDDLVKYRNKIQSMKDENALLRRENRELKK